METFIMYYHVIFSPPADGPVRRELEMLPDTANSMRRGPPAISAMKRSLEFSRAGAVAGTQGNQQQFSMPGPGQQAISASNYMPTPPRSDLSLYFLFSLLYEIHRSSFLISVRGIYHDTTFSLVGWQRSSSKIFCIDGLQDQIYF